jgi:hypothetical protein
VGTAATIGLFFAAAAVSVALTGAVQAFFAPRGRVSSGGPPRRCRAAAAPLPSPGAGQQRRVAAGTRRTAPTRARFTPVQGESRGLSGHRRAGQWVGEGSEGQSPYNSGISQQLVSRCGHDSDRPGGEGQRA